MSSQTRKYGKSFNVNFHFDNYPNKKKDGRVKISLVVNLSGKKEYYPILPEAFMYRKYWREAVDPDTGHKLGHNFVQSRSNKDYEQVYPVIAEAKVEMENLIRRSLKRKKTVTHTLLKRSWNRESKTFGEFFANYIESEVRRLSKSTHKNYQNVKNRIVEFDAEVKLAEVSWEWLQEFQNWLLLEAWNPLKLKRGLHESTVKDFLKKIGAVLRWAKTRGEIDDDPYYEFKGLQRKIKCQVVPPNPLPIEEVLRLEKAYRNEELRNLLSTKSNGVRFSRKDSWHNLLQLILISIYTGVRYSDLKQLDDPKKFKIKTNQSGSRIHFRMQKTKTPHAILITKRLEAVMVDNEDGTFFLNKVPSPNTINKRLRDILAHFGFDNDRHWHDLRATFANLVRDLSKDEMGASKALGHTALSITRRHYFDSANPQGDQAVSALDNLGKSNGETDVPEEFLYELSLLKMLNPGMKLTPKVKQWMKKTEEDGNDSTVIPFGVAK